jgi:hypothetical protein
MIRTEEIEEVLARAVVNVLIEGCNLRGVLRLRQKGRIVLFRGRNEIRSVDDRFLIGGRKGRKGGVSTSPRPRSRTLLRDICATFSLCCQG